MEHTSFDRIAAARGVSFKKGRTRLPGRQAGRRGLTPTDGPEKHGIGPAFQWGSSSTKRQLTFQFADPQAVSVFVAGTFNHWDAHSHPLRKVGPGEWCLQMMVDPGRYEYRFVVDGEWKQDPSATARVPNPYGGFNSVVVVQPA